MHRDAPRLTDEDLHRLAHLGGGVDQIAEAAGVDAGQVRRRLDAAAHRHAEERAAFTLVDEVSAQH